MDGSFFWARFVHIFFTFEINNSNDAASNTYADNLLLPRYFLSCTDLALEEAYEKKLAVLRDRVLYAESLNRERENDVNHLRSQLHFLQSMRKSGNRFVFVCLK